jgi:8-oxo-dGTP pyrophosphatase MutT (NUDIX family)
LRWHERQRAWLQVGGHAEPHETDLFDIALREATEETGLDDLEPWPLVTSRASGLPVDPVPVHLVTVVATGNETEPTHRHLDVRYLLATGETDRTCPESSTAALMWLDLGRALVEFEGSLLITLQRVAALFEPSA